VNGNGKVVTVIQAGFSLTYVRDDELDGISDRAKFLRDSIVYMGNNLGQVVGAGPALKNSLSQNYPNPFNPQTTIAFTIKDRGAVTLKVYNVNGELVRTLANENRAAGSYTLVWDGHNDSGQSVSSGVYFYKLVTNSFSQTKKMVLLK
jgi:FlgD Ig-like domain